MTYIREIPFAYFTSLQLNRVLFDFINATLIDSFNNLSFEKYMLSFNYNGDIIQW